jgi:uncharacterized membrane protein
MTHLAADGRECAHSGAAVARLRRDPAVAEPTSARIVFLGFTDEMLARTVLEVVKEGRHDKEFELLDWVMVHKAADGTTKVTNDTGVDPGAKRGGLMGGAAGAAIAILAGPVGLGAVLGGAAIGALTASAVDSGIKNDDIETVSEFMVPGRTGLIIAVPLADADRWNAFVSMHPEFHSAIRRHSVDITPDHTFAQAIDEYRAAHPE